MLFLRSCYDLILKLLQTVQWISTDPVLNYFREEFLAKNSAKSVLYFRFRKELFATNYAQSLLCLHFRFREEFFLKIRLNRCFVYISVSGYT